VLKSLILAVFCLTAYPSIIEAQRHAVREDETYQFFADLNRNSEMFKEYTLLYDHAYVYHNSSSNHLKDYVDNYQTYAVVYKDQYSKGHNKHLDSIVFSTNEQEIAHDFFKNKRPSKWSDAYLPYLFYPLNKRHAEMMCSANYILSEVKHKPKPVYECSRPLFLRNNTLAIFLFQTVRGSDAYGQLGIYKKGPKGWELFTEIHSWEGVYRLGGH
jgi:hypothetical protein